MQDYDFGKYYQRQSRVTPTPSSGAGSNWVKKLSLLSSIIIVTFFVGMIAGIFYQKDRSASPADSAGGPEVTQTSNVNPDQPAGETPQQILSGLSSDSPERKDHASGSGNDRAEVRENKTSGNFSETLQSDKSEYIILAKIYSSYEEAHLNGLKLQKVGLPVFLTESGSKMKVYVGPISGKNQAYNMLGRIKKIREFNGAILYQK